MVRMRPLVLGASGQLGTGLRAACLTAFEHATWHSRVPSAGCWCWDMLNDPVPAVECTAIVYLVRGKNADIEAELATRACQLADEHSVPILLASSQAVYGRQSVDLTEDIPIEPADDNGLAKARLEEVAKSFDNATILRIGNVAGAGALFHSMNAGTVVLDRFASGEGPKRAFIGARSFGYILGQLLEREELPRVVNIAYPGLIDMAAILDAEGANWYWRDAPPSAQEVVRLNVNKLCSLVDVPELDIPSLLREARLTGWDRI